ncbi:MAG TPA: hypothetical protein GX741_02245 [Erysipelothrix sp.]|nr:hypothetical protein [Erysipelothrix sp.]
MINKQMNAHEFERFKTEYFERENVKQRHQAIHERFEQRVKGAIKLRDRSREGLADEEISITLYGWIQRYLSLTDRYDHFEGVVVNGVKGAVVVDYITEEIVFQAE